MINLLVIFVYSLIFNTFLIQELFRRDLIVADIALSNLQNDFLSISFPVSFEINAFAISFVLSLLLSILLKIFVLNNFSINNPKVVLSNLINLYFIYSGVLLSVLWMLRIYNLSRGIIILATIVFPVTTFLLILFINLNVFNKISESKYLSFIPYVIFLLLIVFVFIGGINNDDEVSKLSVTTTTTTTTIPLFLETTDDNCFKWKGSSNFVSCSGGSLITNKEKYSESINNIVEFGGDIFTLDVFGKIFKNKPDNLYLDISQDVMNRLEMGRGESGLFGLAFHPSENYFLVSFSDKNGSLVLRKYFLDKEGNVEIDSAENIMMIPNSPLYHYSGALIWSEFFNDFLFGIGDMNYNGNSPYTSEPLDTTSPRGKILFVNSNISQPAMLSLDNLKPVRNDILAYGLRNPWKIVEYKNYLFISDVGHGTEEELNVLDLREFKTNKIPYLLGWPHFEASIDLNVEYNEIFLFVDNEPESINEYIKSNSIPPNVFYSHEAPENYRAAIIGGGVVEDKNSKYFQHYIFADYLSSELFAYDFINDSLYSLPLNNLGTNIHSLFVDTSKTDTVLLGSSNGLLIEVTLP